MAFGMKSCAAPISCGSGSPFWMGSCGPALRPYCSPSSRFRQEPRGCKAQRGYQIIHRLFNRRRVVAGFNSLRRGVAHEHTVNQRLQRFPIEAVHAHRPIRPAAQTHHHLRTRLDLIGDEPRTLVCLDPPGQTRNRQLPFVIHRHAKRNGDFHALVPLENPLRLPAEGPRVQFGGPLDPRAYLPPVDVLSESAQVHRIPSDLCLADIQFTRVRRMERQQQPMQQARFSGTVRRNLQALSARDRRSSVGRRRPFLKPSRRRRSRALSLWDLFRLFRPFRRRLSFVLVRVDSWFQGGFSASGRIGRVLMAP